MLLQVWGPHFEFFPMYFFLENIYYSPVYKVNWNEGNISTTFINLKYYSPLKWKEYEVSHTLKRSLNNCLGFKLFSSVQLLSHVWVFVIPWTTARQASLFITNSQSLLKLISIESGMPSNHLILHCPLLLPLTYLLKV